MRKIPKLSGSGMTRAAWDSIASAIEANFNEVAIQPGYGYVFNRTSGGTSLTIKQNNPSFNAPKNPFDISLAFDSGSSTTKINVWPGTINGIMPENIFDDFTISGGDLHYVKATIDTDGSAVTSVTLNVDTSTPDVQHSADGSMPSGFDVLLGLCKAGDSVSTGLVYNIAGGNVTLTATQAFNLGYWAVS